MYLNVHSSWGISLMFGSGVISSLSYNLDTAVFDADQVSLSLIGWWILQLSLVWRTQTTFVECAVLSGSMGTSVYMLIVRVFLLS